MSKLPVVLVINAGSSSLKFKVFDYSEQLNLLLQGQISGLDIVPNFKGKNAKGDVINIVKWEEKKTHGEVFAFVLDWIHESLSNIEIAVVGHRVVHGGTKYVAPILVDDTVFNEIKKLITLAPLHQPHNLLPIEVLRKQFPKLPQVAVFDTGYHHTIDSLRHRYAIPTALYNEGVRRYAMHGISYEYINYKMHEVAPDIADKKIVVCHIGSGASLCAIEGGISKHNTLGFTALEGLPMGTRSGSIDPGIILYLIQEKKYTPKDVEEMLYHKCGMKALTNGFTSDFYEIETSDTSEAKFAFEYMAFRVAEEICRLQVTLSGLDAIVFTAGLGENSAKFRSMVARQLAFMGVQIDEIKNKEQAFLFSKPNSNIHMYTLPTNEEWMIAKHSVSLI